MGGPQTTHEHSVDSPWTARGQSMHSQTGHGQCVGSPGTDHRRQLTNSQRTALGQLSDAPQTVDKQFAESPRTSHRWAKDGPRSGSEISRVARGQPPDSPRLAYGQPTNSIFFHESRWACHPNESLWGVYRQPMDSPPTVHGEPTVSSQTAQGHSLDRLRTAH